MQAKAVSSKFREVCQINNPAITPTNRYITGNYYSFQNAHKKEARLFFTQGCIPGEGEETATTSKPAVQDSEFEGEAEAEPEASSSKATKARGGRPKGKQKAK